MQNKNCYKKVQPRQYKSRHQSAPFTKTICVVAGGSGGHITPALVLANKWKDSNPDGFVLFFSNAQKLDRTIVGGTKDVQVAWLNICKIPGKKLWRYPGFFYYLIVSFLKSFFILRKQKPSKIITTGGLIALPVCIAGKLLSIPIELYELNVTPGKAINTLSPLARDIFITFDKSRRFFRLAHQNKCTVKPYPLRFCERDRTYDRETLRKSLQFTPDRKTIFLLGGSKGSISLNNMFKKWIEEGAHETPLQVIHQTGSYDATNWSKFYAQRNIPAHTFTYTPDIKPFYQLADLIICRAGAGTLFELEFFQKPSIIVPLKNHAGNHQVENAREMASRYPGLFVVSDKLM